MSLRNISRRRKWIMLAGLALTGILIWWAQVFDPVQSDMTEIREDIERFTQERDRLSAEIEKVTALIAANPVDPAELARYQEVKVDGKRIEEVNSGTQAMIQQFMEQKGLSIKTYKELPVSKWRDYAMGRIEIQFETQMQGLSDVLEYMESLNKLIRVERLTVNYRRTKQSDLLVSMQIGTLLLDEVRP
jgi:archaellum component FlaC